MAERNAKARIEDGFRGERLSGKSVRAGQVPPVTAEVCLENGGRKVTVNNANSGAGKKIRIKRPGLRLNWTGTHRGFCREAEIKRSGNTEFPSSD